MTLTTERVTEDRLAAARAARWPSMTPVERFWSKVDGRGEAGCWLWTAGSSRRGYGQFFISPERGNTPAHRFAYELLVGPIPAGLVLDHLCRVHGCVNPAHLEAVTDEVNIKRGVGQGATNARKTECVNGHPFNALNTRITPRGTRTCRPCERERKRRKSGLRAPCPDCGQLFSAKYIVDHRRRKHGGES